MDIYRIGDKLISQKKVLSALEKILKLRSQGKSQHEVADITGVDRSFISRLETLGELRKAKQIGVVGFPVKNKDEIQRILAAKGIQHTLLMSEAERTSFVEGKPGADIINEMMELIQQFRMFDTVIVLASDMRTKWIESLLNCQTILVDIGTSPLTEDVYVDPERIIEILDHLT
ncbi:MAG: transcriptional regulator [Caldicoprobacterales bacterium]|jgi:transcriptional regulator with XRE-family HTH domain|nr:helix-turn-helix transcriptional regulator [Clostridiales bacterium]